MDEEDRQDEDLTDTEPEASSPIWMGGVPSTYTIMEETSLTTVPFAGCLGDITVNSM